MKEKIFIRKKKCSTNYYPKCGMQRKSHSVRLRKGNILHSLRSKTSNAEILKLIGEYNENSDKSKNKAQ